MSDTILIVPSEIARRHAANYRMWFESGVGRRMIDIEELRLSIFIERAVRESRLSAEAREEVQADAEADRVREHEEYDQ